MSAESCLFWSVLAANHLTKKAAAAVAAAIAVSANNYTLPVAPYRASRLHFQRPNTNNFADMSLRRSLLRYY